MYLKRYEQHWWWQFLDITRLQLSNWRWSWRPMLITGILSPVLTIIMLGTVGRSSDASVQQYVLTGSIVMALLFENQNKVAANFSFMREEGMLDYFKTVPVRPGLLAPATVSAFFLLSLPAIVITILFGSWFLDIQMHPNAWVFLVVPLSALSLAGIGATIGVLAPSQEASGTISMFMVLVLVCLGPVMISPSSLPDPMKVIGLFSPAAHAASALRQALLGGMDKRTFAFDIIFLAVMAALTLSLADRAMKRRI